MLVNIIILRDSTDSLFDDYITFDEDVEYSKIIEVVEKAKEKEDYTNEDIYKALDSLGVPFQYHKFYKSWLPCLNNELF